MRYTLFSPGEFHVGIVMMENTTLQALQNIADRLRFGTSASRTTIRLDCEHLSELLETVAVESLGENAGSLKKEWIPNALILLRLDGWWRIDARS